MQKLTKNVAKLLILLENIPISDRYCKVLARRMNKDYNYINRLLDRLESTGWVRSDKVRIKKYFNITVNAPMIDAKHLLTNQPDDDTLQQVML